MKKSHKKKKPKKKPKINHDIFPHFPVRVPIPQPPHATTPSHPEGAARTPAVASARADYTHERAKERRALAATSSVQDPDLHHRTTRQHVASPSSPRPVSSAFSSSFPIFPRPRPLSATLLEQRQRKDTCTFFCSGKNLRRRPQATRGGGSACVCTTSLLSTIPSFHHHSITTTITSTCLCAKKEQQCRRRRRRRRPRWTPRRWGCSGTSKTAR